MTAIVPTRRAIPQLRVLVVDDNVDGAEALCALLASMGCATAVAFDVAQGLATAARFDPDLALIDLEMPGMNGCDMARCLRVPQAHSSARLICLTGRGHAEDRRLCIDAGFDDFFTKPMLPETLVEVVSMANAALIRSGARSESVQRGR
jgi:DNA-binding response OmpR family regulator